MNVLWKTVISDFCSSNEQDNVDTLFEKSTLRRAINNYYFPVVPSKKFLLWAKCSRCHSWVLNKTFCSCCGGRMKEVKKVIVEETRY